MTYLLLALLVLAVLSAGLGIISHLHGESDDIVVPPKTSCATCEGTDERCEQECMMEAATKDIEYYDDEELDTYQGRPANQYTDDEIEAFSEVMYTMRPQELKDWGRSLLLRGINLPNALKDEFIALVEDAEQQKDIE